MLFYKFSGNSSHTMINMICTDHEQNWNVYLLCFLLLKYFPFLLAEFLFQLIIHFAQNSVGKVYQI